MPNLQGEIEAFHVTREAVEAGEAPDWVRMVQAYDFGILFCFAQGANWNSYIVRYWDRVEVWTPEQYAERVGHRAAYCSRPELNPEAHGPIKVNAHLVKAIRMQGGRVMSDPIDIMAKAYCHAAMMQGHHVDQGFCEERLRIALNNSGLAIVPVEPTEAMIDAFVSRALQVSINGEGGWSNYARNQWKQMLSHTTRKGASV